MLISEIPDRLRLVVQGAVQGVGFRPFVYRLAQRLDLAGWVQNSSQGVTIEVEGPASKLADFEWRLRAESPPRAAIQTLKTTHVSPRGEAAFAIRESAEAGRPTAVVLPDVATCRECLAEVLDPADRRHNYPFTNCTSCGPRYSIVLGLPYDREHTTMAGFAMCPACRAEYEDPRDRRFHAEPNACPDCGPQLALLDPGGASFARRDEALLRAAEAIVQGRIVAVKGLGGFHLLVDARNDDAVRELRRRKRREEKPLAVMVASLAEARRSAALEPLEEQLLASAESPIVLVRRRSDVIAEAVAPGNPNLGLLLPYTPLHHLLLRAVGFPVVATSGNLSDEPLCTKTGEALERLRGIADLFLVHDRPIARPVDDSVVRVVAGRELVLRRARGYAPFPLLSSRPLPSLLAVGGHLKNAVAVTVGDRIVTSPHVGDLDTEPALGAFHRTVEALTRLYEVVPAAVACDAHPDYASTQFARRSGHRVIAVQHHYAHVLACLADNALEPPALGFAWDGSGYGGDGTIWGGEALRVDEGGFARVAWLRPFPLPGGEQAVREPRRSALGALYVLAEGAPPPPEVARLFTATERRVLDSMLHRGLNCPLASSVGRLFDVVAALAGLMPVTSYEGQAAMALEHALAGTRGDDRYDLEITALMSEGHPAWVLDWRPLVEQVLLDVRAGRDTGRISLRFHNALAEAVCAVAERVGEERVALTGGCFQNKYLTERAVRRLTEAGLRPLWHRRIPPGDGGLAVGQVLAAATELQRR
jgi:hydrogenase maturation protein HypF